MPLFLTLYFFCLSATLFAEPLTFSAAMYRVLSESPQLKMSTSSVQEKSGELLQSQMYPNPIVSWSAENIYGNKDWNKWDAAEQRYEIAQPIETGGKRCYRANAASFNYQAQQYGLEGDTLVIFNQLARAFAGASAAQESLRVTEELLKVSETTLDIVRAKTEAGKVSVIQQNKAEIALANAAVQKERAFVNFKTAKEKLALIWGSSFVDFETVDFAFYEIGTPADLDACNTLLVHHPEANKAHYQHLASEETVQLEKSQRIPNVMVTVGVKTLRDTHNKGMILGAGIPLPVFDQNYGNIHKAQAMANRASEKVQYIYMQLSTKLSIAHQQLMQAYRESVRLQTNVLKKAEESFSYAQEGYKEGKFEYLDLLDSQRTLFEVKEQYIQALLNYHERKADIDYLYFEVN